MHVADFANVLLNQLLHTHHLTSLHTLLPPWWRGGSWSRLSAAGWWCRLLFLFTRGQRRRVVRGRQRVTPLLTPFTGGGVVISGCNLNIQLIGVWRFGCRGLSSRAQIDTWLGYFGVFSIIFAMYGLDTAGATNLKTYFGCGVLLLGVNYMYIAWNHINTNCIFFSHVLHVLRTP